MTARRSLISIKRRKLVEGKRWLRVNDLANSIIGAAYLVADRPAIALGFGENGRAGGRRERCSSTVMVP